MFLNSLQLRNFRNYEKLNIKFDSKKILLIGKNAQGKSNILEAIEFLSCLQTTRAKSDSELVLWGKEQANIRANLQKDNVDIDLEVTITPSKKKLLKVNGLTKSKSSDFTSQLKIVNFNFSDLLLLKGMPDERRNWLDMAISQVYPAYLERLSKYNKIRIQKNNCLKKFAQGQNQDADLLDVWDTQLVTAGSNIIYLRQKFLKELQKPLRAIHAEISENEHLEISYSSTITEIFDTQNDEIAPIEEIAQIFTEKIRQRRQEEIIRTQSLVGPNRDDLLFFINSNDAKKFSSQGQQRTIVLSLKLSELELIKNQYNHSPLLLLDDVLAELDDIRQNYLLNIIEKNSQTIITSVDTLHFAPEYLKNVQIFKISEGKIIN